MFIPVRSLTLQFCLLAAALFVVYWTSVPVRFNTVYENRRFFDSDGEFIVRQYRQGKTFTHNDHLLYHVLARAIHEGWRSHRDQPTGVARTHLMLSAVSGALGVAMLFAFGARLTGRRPQALGCALFVGGCAGWWFFSGTVDTYLPCLCASVFALGLGLRLARDPAPLSAALFGAAMGLAFLFRTDGFLLAPLGLVLLRHPARFWRNLGIVAASGALVGGLGYALLAWQVYDVPWGDIHRWAMGSLDRPEAAAKRQWGVAANLTAAHIRLSAVNHALYAVVLPSLHGTRSIVAGAAYSGAGRIVPLLWGAAGALATALVLGTAAAGVARRDPDRILPMALALLWFVPRLLFYTWWDPFDPFLFAVMSLPAFWLILIETCRRLCPPDADARRVRLVTIGVFAVASAVWAHNLACMILPLRRL